jgi:ABC-type sulfate transport system substrate-binding protein
MLGQLTVALLPLTASVALSKLLQAAVPGTQLDITSILVQVPLVFLVVWIINTRDRQWREMFAEQNAQWRQMMETRDEAWRLTLATAHEQGTESVGAILGELKAQMVDNNKVLTGNATRLEALVRTKVKEMRVQ